MALFKYQVKDKSGKLRLGLVEAANLDSAADLLRERNFFIISIIEQKKRFNIDHYLAKFKRVGFNDIVDFTRQLSAMVSAGLQLTDCLAIMRAQVRNPAMLSVVEDIASRIEGGSSFAAALERHPKNFSKIYISLVRAGELSGKLDTILNRLSASLDKMREFRVKIRSAMIYPMIILIGMGAVIFIMMAFVLPKLTSLYKGFGIELPITTQLLIKFSDFFAAFWPLVIVAVIGLFIAFSRFIKTPFGKRKFDQFILHLPIFGTLIKQTILTELTSTMSLLASAGISILDSLHISSEATDNILYQEELIQIAHRVEKGFPLGLPVSQSPLFPPILGQMITVGEETGKLDESLSKMSYYFQLESEEAIKGLTSAIEPAIMVVLGVSVGFLVISIISPIYNLTSQF